MPFLYAWPKCTLILGAESKQKKVQIDTAFLTSVLHPLTYLFISFPVVSNTAGLTTSDREPCVHTCTALKRKREWSSSQKPKYHEQVKAHLTCSALSTFSPTFRAKCPAAHGLRLQPQSLFLLSSRPLSVWFPVLAFGTVFRWGEVCEARDRILLTVSEEAAARLVRLRTQHRLSTSGCLYNLI